MKISTTFEKNYSLCNTAIFILSCIALVVTSCTNLNLPAIKSATSIGTSLALTLAKATPKTRQQVYLIAKGARSLATGQVPTVPQLQAAMAQYITDPVAQTIGDLVAQFYASQYSKLNGNGKLAADMLEAIAEGVENGAGVSNVTMRKLPPDIQIALVNFFDKGSARASNGSNP